MVNPEMFLLNPALAIIKYVQT